jgi:hypothetical protein
MRVSRNITIGCLGIIATPVHAGTICGHPETWGTYEASQCDLVIFHRLNALGLYLCKSIDKNEIHDAWLRKPECGKDVWALER